MTDRINSLFQLAGGLMVWANCAAVVADGQVAGVRWWTTALFAAWGLWNLYYFREIGHLKSWRASLVMVAGNIVWVGLLASYS